MTTEGSPVSQGASSAVAISDAGLATSVGDTSARRAWLGPAIAIACAILVFWVFAAMPFMDLPAHEGLIAVRHRFASSPFEQRYLVYAPHIGPYSLFRFLGEIFVSLVGPNGSIRALATLPAIATPLALLFARRRLHRDRSPAFGYFGVVLSFGLMTLFGFASYLLGLAVMLFALTLWLELMAAVDAQTTARDVRRRELIAVAVAPLVFVAHGHAFILFLALAGVSAIVTGRRARRLVRLRALVPAIVLAAYVAWRERAASVPLGSVPQPSKLTLVFHSAYDKLTLLITPTLMTRSGIDAAIGAILWVLVIAGCVATARELRVAASEAAIDTDVARSRSHARALLACMLVIAAAFLALPHEIGWFGFVDGRLAPIVLFLGLMAVRTETFGPILRASFKRFAPAAVVVILSVAFVASYLFQDEARGYQAVLALVPTNARLLNLPLDPNSDIFTGHPFVHYDKLALAERPILVSDNWFHQGSAIYPRPSHPALRLPADYVSSDLHVVAWDAYHLEDWDYVLVRTRPRASAPSIPIPASLTLIEHRDGWWLYRSSSGRSPP